MKSQKISYDDLSYDTEKNALESIDEFLEDFDPEDEDTIELPTFSGKRKPVWDWWRKGDGTFYTNWLEDVGNKHIEKHGHRSYLPKGTIIYHGSIDLFHLNKNKSLYFGIDPDVSFMILTEKYSDKYKKIKKINEEIDPTKYLPTQGYLYVFRLKKDLPVYFSIPFGEDDESKFEEKTKACHYEIPCIRDNKIMVYPKTPEPPYYESCFGDAGPESVELVIPGKFVTKYLEYVETYLIDIDRLFIDCTESARDENDDYLVDPADIYNEMDPFDSVVGKVTNLNPL